VKTVCVDLDGVLAAYSGWKGIEHIGDPLPGAVEFTHAVAEFARVLVYTSRCRSNPGGARRLGYAAGDDDRSGHDLAGIVRAWLDRHGFRYDDVWAGPGKPTAAAYVDDRAVPCEPQVRGGGEFATALARASTLCGVKR
jgi:hypothetical protein